MADDKPQGFKEEQALWNAYLESRQSRGINIEQDFAKWAEQQVQKLNSPGAREDFAELCKDGCNPQVLAAIITLIRYCPRFESIWAMMVGRSGHILSSYVDRATGRPHDKNVSGLIAEIGDSPDYNEVAYRMWRNRNYERLEKHFSWIIDLLVAMVTARPT